MYTLNDTLDEKLSGAITLAYDKVNARVSVTALFPEPICLKAAIMYNNQRLPNGDFDIIVLSSKYSRWRLAERFLGEYFVFFLRHPLNIIEFHRFIDQMIRYRINEQWISLFAVVGEPYLVLGSENDMHGTP